MKQLAQMAGVTCYEEHQPSQAEDEDGHEDEELEVIIRKQFHPGLDVFLGHPAIVSGEHPHTSSPNTQ